MTEILYFQGISTLHEHRWGGILICVKWDITKFLPPSSMVFGKLTNRAVMPLRQPATTNSLGSFVEEVIWNETRMRNPADKYIKNKDRENALLTLVPIMSTSLHRINSEMNNVCSKRWPIMDKLNNHNIIWFLHIKLDKSQDWEWFSSFTNQMVD